MNSNVRSDAHPRVRPVKSKRIRGRFAAAGEGAETLNPPVAVDVQLTFGRRSRRDSPNWYPTIKAAIDGLVDAGVLPDDSDANIASTLINAHMTDPLLRAVKGVKAAEVRVAITVSEVGVA